jgi:hypothetical protein
VKDVFAASAFHAVISLLKYVADDVLVMALRFRAGNQGLWVKRYEACYVHHWALALGALQTIPGRPKCMKYSIDIHGASLS